MKLYKSKKDDELYYYFLKNGEKMWMYRHKYKDTLGIRREKKKSSFKTENAAYRGLLEIRAALMNGQHKRIENEQITVTQWLRTWYDTYSNDWEVSTRIERKATIENIIIPRIGNKKLLKLDKTTYKSLFLNDLLQTYKPSSVKLFHSRFMIAINAAIEDEILQRNRLNKVRIEQDKPLDNFLTPQELTVFLKMSEKQGNITNHTMIMLLAYTGLRQGEARGLKWKNIDLKEKTITVERTRDQHGVRSPKTKNSYRTIGIDDIVLNQLQLYQKWCIETKFRYGESLDKKDDFVFISEDGSPCSYYVLYDAFSLIYKQCKKEGLDLKTITPHGLRHSHCTILINNNVPAKTIADRLGNTVGMIYKVYSHSFKELEDQAVISFTNALSGAKSGAK